MATFDYLSEETVRIDTKSGPIYGTLTVPERMWAGVIFAQGSGASRNTPRNKRIAGYLHQLGLATLLVDLLTPAEERIDSFTAQHRFDVPLLTERILDARKWFVDEYGSRRFSIGFFGSSVGAAAALTAAAIHPEIPAVVSRGGRPEMAGEALSRVKAATLLIVGGLDRPVIDLNRTAYESLTQAYRRELAIVPEATHLFDERGALDQVAQRSGQWFVRYLGADTNRHDRYRSPSLRQSHAIL